MARKKTPCEINAQFNKIAAYYFRKSDVPNEEVRKRTLDKIDKLRKKACEYTRNIYLLAKVEMYGDTEKSNNVWFFKKATKEQYTNNK